MAIVNSIQKDEFFLPISFGDSEEGIYIYPWLSEHKIPIEFNGFTQYVKAGGLFGASLKGEDQQGGKFSLIKHDIKFCADQKIQFIMYDEKESPYENMLFVQLEKTCQMINSFAVYENKKNLLYHLPYYDYLLFGIELFLRGRITHDALSDFFEKVLKKKSEHTDKINLICKKYGILSTIFSPFENIFDTLQNAIKAGMKASKIPEVIPVSRISDAIVESSEAIKSIDYLVHYLSLERTGLKVRVEKCNIEDFLNNLTSYDEKKSVKKLILN